MKGIDFVACNVGDIVLPNVQNRICEPVSDSL